jgi:hypothetical protein
MIAITCKQCSGVVPNDDISKIRQKLLLIAKLARRGQLNQKYLVDDMYPICSRCLAEFKELWDKIDETPDSP